MGVRYKYSGLTEELYQRLVSEHAALKQAHKKGSYKQLEGLLSRELFSFMGGGTLILLYSCKTKKDPD